MLKRRGINIGRCEGLRFSSSAHGSHTMKKKKQRDSFVIRIATSHFNRMGTLFVYDCSSLSLSMRVPLYGSGSPTIEFLGSIYRVSCSWVRLICWFHLEVLKFFGDVVCVEYQLLNSKIPCSLGRNQFDEASFHFLKLGGE